MNKEQFEEIFEVLSEVSPYLKQSHNTSALNFTKIFSFAKRPHVKLQVGKN